MTQENIEKVRQQFVKASKEFNFTFISPYPLDEKINLFAFGFIDGYGSKSGAIITLEEPPQYEADKNVVGWCKNTIDGSVKSTSNLCWENTIVFTFKNY